MILRPLQAKYSNFPVLPTAILRGVGQTTVGRGAEHTAYLVTWHKQPIVVKAMIKKVRKAYCTLYAEGNKKPHQEYQKRAGQQRDVIAELMAHPHPSIHTQLGFGFYKVALSDPTFYFWASQYMPNGDLYNYIRKTDSPAWNQRTDMMRQVATGLSHMHLLRLLHRDLKPENVLVDNHGQCKITDFDWACMATRSLGYAGSPIYTAPEVLAAGEPCTMKSDVYSFACVAAAIGEWTTLEPFYWTRSLAEVKKTKIDGAIPFTSSIWPNNVASIITLGFLNNPTQRPTSVAMRDQLNAAKQYDRDFPALGSPSCM